MILSERCAVRPVFLATFFIIFVGVLHPGLSFGDTSPKAADIAAEVPIIEAAIAEAEAEAQKYTGGLLGALSQARIETLKLTRAILKKENAAEIAKLSPTGNFKPDQKLANTLLGEMADASARVAEVEAEAEASGGILGALVLARLEAEKLTHAQLRMSYLHAVYGIPFPNFGGATSTKQADPPVASEAPADDAVEQRTEALKLPKRRDNPSSFKTMLEQGITDEPASISATRTLTPPSGVIKDAKPEWADPRFPNIDYTTAAFTVAADQGRQISGWWTIENSKAAIDDSPKIVALNYSLYKERSYAGSHHLFMRCTEGKTAFIFIQDDFLISGYRRSSFDIVYRFDDDPPTRTRWSELTSNKGAGLFGRKAISFLRKIKGRKKLFIRLTESNGQVHDSIFDLSGADRAITLIAEACAWQAAPLSKSSYSAVQSRLNAAGFIAGAPDGVWGAGSKAAMRAFQSANGLQPTGVPDAKALKILGVTPG